MELVDRIKGALVRSYEELKRPESLALITVTLVLVTRHACGSPGWTKGMRPLWESAASVWGFLRFPIVHRQIIAICLQLGVPLLVLALVHRVSFREVGLGLGDVKFWLPLTAIIFLIQIVVIAFYLSKDPVYLRRYPSLGMARHGGAVFWFWESSRLLYMLSWEFLFRGYLLFLLKKRMGILACVVQMVPFVIMHMVTGKPVSEVYFTIFSGLLSAIFVLESRSVWPVVFLHGMGAVMLDIFIVYG